MIVKRAALSSLQAITPATIAPRRRIYFDDVPPPEPGEEFVEIPDEVELGSDLYASNAKSIAGPLFLFRMQLSYQIFMEDCLESCRIIYGDHSLVSIALNRRSTYTWVAAPNGELFVKAGHRMEIEAAEDANTCCWYRRPANWKTVETEPVLFFGGRRLIDLE
jgi:hypothetical protein